MSGIILPTVDFSNISNKSNKSTSKSKKHISISNSDSDSISSIDIDDIDQLIYENGFPSSESISSSSEESDTIKEIIDYSPPVYDGEEPYYLFNRRWEKYMSNKLNKSLHTNILNFINALFETEYNNLISIKKIKEEDIPISKYVVDLIKEDDIYRKAFNIKYNQNIPSHKIINRILNKINFSFVKIENKNGNYYCIKSGILNRPQY